MNTDNHDVYLQLKSIFEGCDTIIDAKPFAQQYIEKYPILKDMINSYMYGIEYNDIIDLSSKQSMMINMDKTTSRDIAMNQYTQIIEKTKDEVYKKTLERIINKKKHIKYQKEYTRYINKKCPHCSRNINMPENTQYIICGYQNSTIGYDFIGCGKDWCFSCGKKLCKSWDVDMLHLEINQEHDQNCCKNHAKNHNLFYDNYCQCNRIVNLNAKPIENYTAFIDSIIN